MMNAVAPKCAVSKKTGQGETVFEFKEDISSTQKASLNNRELKALRKLSHAQ